MFHIRFSRSLLLILPFVTLFPGTPSSVHADINCESEYASAGKRYTEVVIDTSISGTSFLYGQRNGWVSTDSDGTWWYYYLFNDNYNHTVPILFTEDQIYSPEEWYRPFAILPSQNQIRYTSCHVTINNYEIYPIAIYDIRDGDRWETMYSYDEFGMAGDGWTSPIPLEDPPPLPSNFNMSYPMTLPIHGDGGMHVLTRNGNGFEYRRFGFFGEHEIGPIPLFSGVFGTGYEIPTFASDPIGMLVVAILPGYRVGDEDPNWQDDPTNPLLPAIHMSWDFGVTWSDLIWLDNATVPDLPGTNTGCDNASSGWGYGWLKKLGVVIDDNGIIHIATTLMDPANNTAPDYFDSIGVEDYGLWHIYGIPQSGDHDWYSRPITMGKGLIPPFPEDSHYGGRSAISNPSLSIATDGRIIGGFTDCTVINPDSSWSMDYFVIGYKWSYSCWGPPQNITNNPETDMVYFKTMNCASDDNMCVYGIPGNYTSNGPLVSYSVPVDHIPTPIPISVTEPNTEPVYLRVFDPYPNPASRDMSVRFSLSKPADIIASAYDISGHLVSGIYNGSLDTGDHLIRWSPKSLPSGTYCIRIGACDAVASKNVVIIR